ncbi:phosphatase PAP2 family protein [uncultured Helcococcus sp.]|uniref:phosphatase PAP2 family protein n=1 Tax=uncultured Helcococcus sp. TaxID=1072508 RepID=UPI002619B7C8|nr:phosphatase PAP2 family protein [uncultured Helcococcus sp.]
MKIKKDKIFNYLLIYGIACLLIASLYDLDINKALYNRNGIYPNFFRLTAEMPMIIIFSTACLTYIRFGFYRTNKILLALLAIASVGFPLVSSFTSLSYFEIHNVFFSLLIFLFYMACSYLISRSIDSKNRNRVLIYSLFVIISIISILLSFSILKGIWGRTRFFPMHQGNDYTMFTHWWQIPGNSGSDIFRSFPSGHTGAAASTFVLILLPSVFYKNKFIKKYENFFLFGPIVWTLLVQFARIFDGAHYLSDTAASIIISCLVISLTKNMLKKFIK